MNIIRPISNAQGTGTGPKAGQHKVIADTTSPMDLDGGVNHLQHCVGGQELGSCNLTPCLQATATPSESAWLVTIKQCRKYCSSASARALCKGYRSSLISASIRLNVAQYCKSSRTWPSRKSFHLLTRYHKPFRELPPASRKIVA